MDENDIKHIAIIMDGNRRWAEQKGLGTLQGHKMGSDAAKRVIKACSDLKIKYLTLYAFSTENWKRPEYEVNGLMILLKTVINKNVEELMEKGVRLRAIGRLDELPSETRKAVFKAVERTSGNSDLNLIVALNYGGRSEIIDATKKICGDLEKKKIRMGDLNEEVFRKYLYLPDVPDPEILIRSSGELRISNFLLWQISYSEFWFSDKLWPDFGKEDIVNAIETFRKRERRFGLR